VIHLAFLDVETTGLDPRRHEVIDIWVRRVVAGSLELVGEAGGLISPWHIHTADPEALRINGFDEERWEREGQQWHHVWPGVEPLLADAIIVGSNPSFDVGFIQIMCRRDGLEAGVITRHAVDTASLAHPLVMAGDVRSGSLGALVEHFGVVVDEPAHTARGDVLRTVEVYRHLMGLAARRAA